ncbi:hypothetical protein [Lentzea jiangxiensis]|uniref:Uncharacterized protein n=1 Tax=Lentzea jiangxiensis TaxID=641025 RepID=A0A1H0JVN5_9PSEU|nr:hypothetical protein SAMN05421507_102647 [Lentzea jiangxiensis]
MNDKKIGRIPASGGRRVHGSATRNDTTRMTVGLGRDVTLRAVPAIR